MTYQNVSRLLRRLMSEADDGRGITISELARLTEKPRSTIHRHLRGERIGEDSILAYAKAFAPHDPARQQQIAAEFKQAAGYPIGDPGAISEEIRAMTIELEQLDRDQLDVIWKLLSILRKSAEQSNVRNVRFLTGS